MYSAEKFTATGLRSFEAAYALSGFAFEATERVTNLTLDTVRNGIDEGALGLKAFAAVREPREAVVLAAGMIEPTLLWALSHVRGCYGIGTAYRASLSGFVEEQAKSFETEMNAAFESLADTLPQGAKAFADAVRTTLSGARAAAGEAGKASREVLSLAEEHAASSADAAVKLVSGAARKVA